MLLGRPFAAPPMALAGLAIGHRPQAHLSTVSLLLRAAIMTSSNKSALMRLPVVSSSTARAPWSSGSMRLPTHNLISQSSRGNQKREFSGSGAKAYRLMTWAMTAALYLKISGVKFPAGNVIDRQGVCGYGATIPRGELSIFVWWTRPKMLHMLSRGMLIRPQCLDWWVEDRGNSNLGSLAGHRFL